jgi:hypothetical protein
MRPDEQRSFEDSREINLDDQEALRFWAERMEATPEELAEAVHKVGANRTAVGIYLGSPNAL